MSTDISDDPTDRDQALRLSSLVGDILADAVRFAHNRLGADYLGLGATLPHPNLIDFGRKIRTIPGIADVTTTTGRGGTVYMIAQTVHAVLEQSAVAFDGRIGCWAVATPSAGRASGRSAGTCLIFTSTRSTSARTG